MIHGFRAINLRLFKMTAAITALLVVLSSTAIQAQQPQGAPVSPAPQYSPQDVYHAAWQAVAATVYDQSKLKNWDEFAHKFCQDIKTDEDAIRFANKMLETLDDPYAVLHTPKEWQALNEQMTGTMAGIGVQFNVKTEADGKTPALSADQRLMPNSDADGHPLISRTTDGGAAAEAGIKPGDAIVSVNGVSVAGKSMDDLKQTMRDKVGTSVKIVYRRDGRDTAVDIVRREVKLPPAELPTRRFGNIGYVYLPSFTSNATVSQLRTALKKLEDCQAYILDERFNTGGQINVCIDAAGLFQDKGVIAKTRQRNPRGGYVSTVFSLTENSLRIEYTDEASGRTQTETVRREANLTGNKPLVLLTNGMSMSASEILAGFLKDNERAILVGEKTGGKGVGQSVIPMLNGTALRVTNLRFFSPNGTWVGDGHKALHGITPHHDVKLSDPKTVASDQDEQLNFAVKLLTEKLVK